MDENSNATETSAPTIAPEENLEDKVSALEAEKVKLLEEKENYRKAYLKSSKAPKSEDDEPEDDDKLKRIVDERLAESRLAEIARELNDISQKALKENKELKLALQNKTKTPPAAMGTHSESPTAVADGLVTSEQLAYFKSRGWSDKDIERYKKNLQKKV